MPHATARELESLLDELAAGVSLQPARMALLSELSAQEASGIAARWEEVPPAVRERLLDEATALAAGDVTLDFSRLAQIGLDDPVAAVRVSAIAALWEARERDAARM